MATTTILRQDENSAVVTISGAGIETLAFVLHPGGATGPIGATGFAGSTGVGIVSLEKIKWSITGDNRVSLYFNGSTDQLIGHYSGNGSFNYIKDYQTKITNVAAAADSTILLTSTQAHPYTLVMKLEKTSGFVKVGQYS